MRGSAGTVAPPSLRKLLTDAATLAETYDPDDAESYGDWADRVMEQDWSGLDKDERQELTNRIARRDKTGLWYEVHGVVR